MWPLFANMEVCKRDKCVTGWYALSYCVRWTLSKWQKKLDYVKAIDHLVGDYTWCFMSLSFWFIVTPTTVDHGLSHCFVTLLAWSLPPIPTVDHQSCHSFMSLFLDPCCHLAAIYNLYYWYFTNTDPQWHNIYFHFQILLYTLYHSWWAVLVANKLASNYVNNSYLFNFILQSYKTVCPS